MDRRIAELNIEHLLRKLEEETDPELRVTMQQLLEEERAKLRRILEDLRLAKKAG